MVTCVFPPSVPSVCWGRRRHRNPFRLIHRHVRKGPKALRALYELDYNTTSSPPFFHQWKQAITAYPFTSLMGFSATLLSVVMEHPLVKIHMASFMKIAANHNWNGEGCGGVGHFPITDLLENVSEISSLHSCLTFSSGFDYIHFKFWSGRDVILLQVLAVILVLKICCPSWEPASAELLQHCKISSTSAPKNDTRGASCDGWFGAIFAGPLNNKQWFRG